MDNPCNRCQRKGLAILPVLYASVPKEAAEGFTPLGGNFGEGVIDKQLAENSYVLRGLEAGYLYLLYPNKVWKGYMIDAAGYPRYYPDLRIEDMPDSIPEKSDVAACESQGKNHTGIEAITIERPDQINGAVFIAYSRHKWTKDVRSTHAKKPESRMQLIAKLDGSEFKHAVSASPDNLRKWVADFKQGAAIRINKYAVAGAECIDRSAKVESIVKAMLSMSGALKQTGLIMALHDPVGILRNLNTHRQLNLTEQALYQANPETAWKKLSSDCIVALRERMFNRKKAEIIQQYTKKPWSKENDPKYLRRSPLTVQKFEFTTQVANGDLPKDSRFIPAKENPHVGHVDFPTDSKVAQDMRGDFARIDKHYDEKKRKNFASDYVEKINNFCKKIKRADEDYAIWLNAKPTLGLPNIFTLCECDFTENNHDCAVPYIKTVSMVVAGGPMTDASMEWFQGVLKEEPSSPRQLLLRPLVGNFKSLYEFLNDDKRDKVYDSIKGWLTAEDVKAGKWLTVALAAYANPILAAAGATAFAVNKDGSLDKVLRAKMTIWVCGALALWEKVEVATVKVRMRIGDLQQATLAVGFAASNLSGMPKNSGSSARIPARMRLPQAIADKSIDAVFWTTEKFDDFLAKLPKNSSTPEAGAKAWVEAANDTMQKVTKSARVMVAPGQSRDVAIKLLKRTDAVLGSTSGILAAGALILQTSQFTSNLDQATKVGGAAQLDALLGLGDAMASLLSAGVEMHGALHEAAIIAKKSKVDKVLLANVGKIAAGFGAVGSAFNAVQSFGVFARRKNEGDKDAQYLHFTAGVVFGCSAGIGGAIALGVANSTFFGAALGLGPAGWAVLFTVVAVGISYAALSVEDNAAEIYVASNIHWSVSTRKERFKNWQEEAAAFTALWYGVKAELEWGDTIGGILGYGMDQLKINIVVTESDPVEGWRYRLWLNFPKGEVEIYNRHSNNVTPFVSPYSGLHAELRAYDHSKPHYTDGKDFKYHDMTLIKEKNTLKIEHPLDISEKRFQRARLEFEYFPDVANQNEKTRFEIARSDSE